MLAWCLWRQCHKSCPPTLLFAVPCDAYSNFITDRPSSRVLAPPGGATNWSFAGDVPADPIRAKVGGAAAPGGTPASAHWWAKMRRWQPATKPRESCLRTACRPSSWAPASFPSFWPAPQPAHSPIKQAPMSAAAAEAPGVAEAVSEDLIGAANMGVAQNNYARPSGQNVGWVPLLLLVLFVCFACQLLRLDWMLPKG